MKKIILFIFFVVVINCNYAQKIETYSGRYLKGEAKYQYYENENYERIFHGNFKYSAKDIPLITVTGQFKNNLRDGKWKCKEVKFGEIKTTILNYVNGNIEGTVNIEVVDSTEKGTKKVVEKCIANFKNNRLVGKYYIETSRDILGNTYTVNINLNENGLADSVSTIRFTEQGIPYIDVLKFQNGALVHELRRNLSDGEILINEDNPPERGRYGNVKTCDWTELAHLWDTERDYMWCDYKGTNPVIVDVIIREQKAEEADISSEIYTVAEEQTDISSKIFTIVQEEAEFPGGLAAMMKYIQQNIQYPAMAREAGISGKCHLKFVVNDKGEIGNVEVLKSVSGCPDCDKEAIRVVKSMPKWKPAKMTGREVNCYFNLPINFSIR